MSNPRRYTRHKPFFASATAGKRWKPALVGCFAVLVLAGLSLPTAEAAKGDHAVFRAKTAGESIPKAEFVHDFDTTNRVDSGSYTLSGGTNIQCAAGHHLVLYSSRFDDPGNNGNRRSELQSWLRLAGANLDIGWSQCYIRRQAGDFEGITAGGGIINRVALRSRTLGHVIHFAEVQGIGGRVIAHIARTAAGEAAGYGRYPCAADLHARPRIGPGGILAGKQCPPGDDRGEHQLSMPLLVNLDGERVAHPPGPAAGYDDPLEDRIRDLAEKRGLDRLASARRLRPQRLHQEACSSTST